MIKHNVPSLSACQCRQALPKYDIIFHHKENLPIINSKNNVFQYVDLGL